MDNVRTRKLQDGTSIVQPKDVGCRQVILFGVICFKILERKAGPSSNGNIDAQGIPILLLPQHGEIISFHLKKSNLVLLTPSFSLFRVLKRPEGIPTSRRVK